MAERLGQPPDPDQKRDEEEESFTVTGVVKWFDPTKGFGFIRPDIGEKDIFIHKTAVINSGLEYLGEGQKVTFETEITSDGKVLASSLTLLD